MVSKWQGINERRPAGLKEKGVPRLGRGKDRGQFQVSDESELRISQRSGKTAGLEGIKEVISD